MTIHYHGTPLTPRAELLKMIGKHFCVSFAEPRDADWCLVHGQSVMWDNGAFSIFTNDGKSLDTKKYYEWLEPRLGFPHWAVIPDVIDGDVEQQRNMVREWPFNKVFAAPVWHIALPIDWLLELADYWPKVCFGSSAQYWQIGTDAWCRRVDEAFNALVKHIGYVPWVHMLRGMSLSGDHWPFASVDSANVARNYNCSRVCPERMARNLDAIQCSHTWTFAPEQQGLFA